jgi:site-specific DNA recombinase
MSAAMKRAAIYLRVSTAAQAHRNREPEGYSIPAQREACQRKAAELSAEVVCEYADRGESAKSADRPQLKALLERVRQERDLDCVIVHKVDRLARNRYDDATISYSLHGAGVELVSVTEQIDATPFGRFMHAIVAANAEFYSGNLAAEAKKGLVQKAKAGGTPTRAPLGYLNVRELIDGREVRSVAIDPERAPHVRFAFAAYATGAYTLDTLGAALEERGLTTRPTATRPPKPLARSQLATLLQNPYYIGTVRYAGVEYEGRHEPLIDRRTFAGVAAVLEAHNHAGEKDRKHHHYLKGSLYCGRCGSRMSLIHAKGNGGTYPYFFCIARMRGTGCRQPYVPVATVEDAVERAYSRVRLPRAQVGRVRQKLDQALAGMRAQAEQEATRQRRRLDKLASEREKLLHAYYAGAIPLGLLKREQERLTTETTHAEHHLELATHSLTDVQATLQKALDLLANCARAYRRAPGHLRRQWNQALFERFLVVDDDLNRAPLAEPFATLADPTLPDRLNAARRSKTAALSGGGSNEALLVGAPGFEPGTSPTRTVRATRLRHAPRNVSLAAGFCRGSCRRRVIPGADRAYSETGRG